MARSAKCQLALPAWSKFLISRPSVSITILLGGPACAACPACPAASCDRPSTPNPANISPIATVDPRYMVISLLELLAFGMMARAADFAPLAIGLQHQAETRPALPDSVFAA